MHTEQKQQADTNTTSHSQISAHCGHHSTSKLHRVSALRVSHRRRLIVAVARLLIRLVDKEANSANEGDDETPEARFSSAAAQT